jgi:predicted transposase YbfD/YdcC
VPGSPSRKPRDPSPRPLPPEEPPTDPSREFRTADKEHGRVEIRVLRRTTILTLGGLWPGMKQGFEIRRQRRVNGVLQEEVVHGITSLGESKANAERLLDLVRTHWRIENCLHYVRDVTLGEDACRVRTGAAPQALAALRNAVVHLISREAEESDESRPTILRRNAANIDLPLQLLGISQVE